MSLDKVVLLISHSGDFFTIDRVTEALTQKGANPFRLDTDQFPLNVGLTAEFNSSCYHHYTLEDQGQRITSEQIKAVWMRRIWEPKFDEDLDPQYRQACIHESQATLEGFWDSLARSHWVDDLGRVKDAQNKQKQLRLASEIGFKIPRTLITNKAEAVRAFFQEVEGKMVSKLLTSLSRSLEYTSFFVYTNTVTPEDLEDAGSLRYCPMVFQEKIPKRKELRVIYVNGNIFVGALDASKYNDCTIDSSNTT
jgi:glutathione synthase/RimK-type ligase-like ATP-grasp enzyme